MIVEPPYLVTTAAVTDVHKKSGLGKSKQGHESNFVSSHHMKLTVSLLFLLIDCNVGGSLIEKAVDT